MIINKWESAISGGDCVHLCQLSAVLKVYGTFKRPKWPLIKEQNLPVTRSLGLRDTAWARVVTVYSKFTYARYSFHLKQPRLGVYFFQPNIEFSSYVYEAV